MGFLFASPWSAELTTFYINVLVLFVFLIILWSDRKKIWTNWALINRIIVGQGIGIIIGYQFIHYYGQRDIFFLSLGLILVIFSGYQLLQPPILRSLPTWVGIAAGIFGGFCTGAFASGGPPIALYMYSTIKNPAEAKKSLQVVFLFGLLWRILNVGLFSNIITLEILLYVVALSPLVMIFTLMGHYFSRYLSSRKFVMLVNFFIMLSGLANIGMALT